MIYLSSFLPTAFPSMKFIENGILREETFVAWRKTAFLDRKLLLLRGDQNFSLSSRLSFLSPQKKPRKHIYLPWILI
jgi:hypothetical protein